MSKLLVIKQKEKLEESEKGKKEKIKPLILKKEILKR